MSVLTLEIPESTLPAPLHELLPGLASTSLTLPDDLPYQTWENIGQSLKAIDKGCAWWVGDWLNYGEQTYGEMYSQALEVTDYAYQTLANTKSVAAQFEFSRRRENLSFGHHEAVAKMEPSKADSWLTHAEEEQLSVHEFRKAIKDEDDPNNVHFSSDSEEWYTPPEIVDRAVQTLGQIDLDPCSNGGESPNIPAETHLTKADDGLSQPWHGCVWMNPPYGRVLSDWIGHCCTEYEAGRVSEALVLVPSRTDTEWFRRMKAHPRCFLWGRLKFSGHENSAPFPSMVAYLGPDTARFIEAFGDKGDIYEAIG